MELIEIIRTSLIIFTVISTVFFVVSYTIYKLRHRNENRPFVKSNEFVAPVVLIKTPENQEIYRARNPKAAPQVPGIKPGS